MRLGTIAYLGCLLAMPTLAAAQTYSASPESIIRPAGVAWRNHVTVADGPCGCTVPVRTDCCQQCCPHCGIRPLCVLSKIGRMLDCLLPCNKCGGGLAHGCFLGRQRGYGCGDCAPGCSTALPIMTDPIPEAPEPPKPEAGTDVRRLPPRPTPSSISESRSKSPGPQRKSPWKVAREASAPTPLETTMARQPKPPVAASKSPNKPAEHSVLRRTSMEEVAPEPAPLKVDAKSILPIIRSQSPPDDEAPENPLR